MSPAEQAVWQREIQNSTAELWVIQLKKRIQRIADDITLGQSSVTYGLAELALWIVTTRRSAVYVTGDD